MHERGQQPASESESMGVRRLALPGGQNELLPRVRELPRVRRSLGAKVAARERGALSGPGSLPERARIAEVARDAEASESRKRLCVLSEGLARRRRILSLGGRLFIVVWITGRGVSESPWIAGGSERVRGTDVPQVGDRLDIATKPARIVQDSAARRREPRGKGPRDIKRKDTVLSQQTSLLQEKGGGV